MIDSIFNSPISDIVFFFINIALIGLAYSWWRNEPHRDYIWHMAIWTILLSIKIAAYFFHNFVLPTLSIENYFTALFWFSTIRGSISYTAFFYFFALIAKWAITWSPKVGRAYAVLQSPIGVAIVYASFLLASYALFSYITWQQLNANL